MGTSNAAMWLALLILGFIWGSSFILMKLALFDTSGAPLFPALDVAMARIAIAGGAVIEDDVLLGGQVGVADRVVIGKGSRVAAKSGVTKSLKPNLAYSGYPAEPNQRRLRRMARQRRESTE